MRVSGWLAACALVLGPASLAGAEEEAAAVVQEGSKVGIEYTLKLDDGSVADTSEGREPLVYQQGAGQMLPGLEQKLVGLEVGDEKQVTLSPEEGYGPVQDDLYQNVPIDQIPEEARSIGSTLMAQDGQGNQRPVTVHAVEDEAVVVDLNHPLAGETLHFDVEIVSID